MLSNYSYMSLPKGMSPTVQISSCAVASRIGVLGGSSISLFQVGQHSVDEGDTRSESVLSVKIPCGAQEFCCRASRDCFPVSRDKLLEGLHAGRLLLAVCYWPRYSDVIDVPSISKTRVSCFGTIAMWGGFFLEGLNLWLHLKHKIRDWGSGYISRRKL